MVTVEGGSRQPASGAGEGGGDGTAAVANAEEGGQPEGWTLERFLAERFPERPDWLKDEKGVNSWKESRELAAKSLAAAQESSAKVMALEKELAAVKTAKPQGAALPETEAVQKLQLELAEAQKKHAEELAEWRAQKAKNELAANPAFMAEFDGKRAVLHEEAADIAAAAGLAAEVVEAVFGAKNEYDLIKALNGVEDEAAAALLKEKGRAFLALSKQKEASLKGPGVAEELKRWRDYEQSMQGALTARFSDALKQQFTAALPKVAERLGQDVFFQTETGRATLAQIAQRFSQGIDLRPEEVVESLALAQSAAVYKQTAESLGRQLAEAQKLLARYEGADPSRVAGDGQPGAGAAPGGLLSGMFARMMPGR